MSIEKLPSGTRGTRQPPSFLMKLIDPVMRPIQKRFGDKMAGMNLLYLHTIGAKSGQARVNTVARVDDGHGGWIICASAGGTATHPSWYHNLVAHPDQVAAELAGKKHTVNVTQLQGADRDEAWQRLTAELPRFKGYVEKTDRELPVLRLTPRD